MVMEYVSVEYWQKEGREVVTYADGLTKVYVLCKW